MELVQIEHISFRYPNADTNALTDVCGTVREGTVTLLCGQTGCGKSTLLRLLKPEIAPYGTQTGEIRYRGRLLQSLDVRESAGRIGFVQQNPESQIVTDKVWHELAFGLENLGLPSGVIRRRVGEMASFFGIQDWFRSSTDALSGGQKQLLNLAAVLVMQPQLLILDEPTAQLDPIAAADFLAMLQRLNRELGLTVLLAEHRLEEALPMADRVWYMESGAIRFSGAPDELGDALAGLQTDHPMLEAMPAAARLYTGLRADDACRARFPRDAACPLQVREGRALLDAMRLPPAQAGERVKRDERAQAGERVEAHELGRRASQGSALSMRGVWFRYEREKPDILRGVTFSVQPQEIYAILGGNGSGKTTALSVMAGLHRAYRGRVCVDGRPIQSYKGNSLYRGTLAYLPQDLQDVFLRETVEQDYADFLRQTLECSKEDCRTRIEEMAQRLGIGALLGRHPYDLSGGEQQQCALGKLLLTRPRFLLLDEPTKGLDAASRSAVGRLLRSLAEDGITVLLVTHDVEFAAQTADRCALFFDGEILSADTPARFFAENSFYTTGANRIVRTYCPEAVTCEQATAYIRKVVQG